MPASTTTAATLIGEDVGPDPDRAAGAASVLAAGPRIFDTSRPLSVPRLVGSDALAFVAENAAIPEAFARDISGNAGGLPR